MYGLFECMSSGCVAQKGDHAKISCQVIQGWDKTLVGHLKCLKAHKLWYLSHHRGHMPLRLSCPIYADYL